MGTMLRFEKLIYQHRGSFSKFEKISWFSPGEFSTGQMIAVKYGITNMDMSTLDGNVTVEDCKYLLSKCFLQVSLFC